MSTWYNQQQKEYQPFATDMMSVEVDDNFSAVLKWDKKTMLVLNKKTE